MESVDSKSRSAQNSYGRTHDPAADKLAMSKLTNCKTFPINSLLHCGYSRSLIKNCKKWALFTTNCNPSTMVTGCKPCLTSNCKLCPFIRSSCTISNNLNHQIYPISQNTSCKTRNCIYALHCTRCTHIPTVYIGETKNACHIRFSKHKHNILLKKDSVISNHFNQPDHNIFMLQVSILQSFNVKHKCPTKFDLI